MVRSLLVVVLGLCAAAPALADGPQDNVPDKVRRVPPPGIAVPEDARRELQAGADELAREVDTLRATFAATKAKARLSAFLPDVQIYLNAVRYALKYDEFYRPDEVAIARRLLDQGRARARQLREGKTPWATATGLVVRGYVSRIDGSVQPYGLVVPASYRAGTAQRHRLDIWYHGRGEKLTELAFLDQRQRSPGEFTPPDAFVLHPYGRYCNANHFAGEIDTFEALENVRQHYRIDENRLVVRGFSMGGAACWNFAVHYADRWAAAAPGAGFSETPDFLRVFQKETLNPTPWERKLWHWYDCTDWARNLVHCPTVAYSGTKDSQKQAADVMAAALRREGISLVHVLGPGTGHSYHPAAKVEINRRIDSIVAKGRDPLPRKVRFVTWTLRYPRMYWVRIEGMDRHWEQARVEADLVSDRGVRVTTQNVTHLTLTMPSGYCPLDMTRLPNVTIDNQVVMATPVQSDRSWEVKLIRVGNRWRLRETPDKDLRKRPGLQGPIDDAFMDRFVMVRPTGKSSQPRVAQWTETEFAHAVDHWRRQFRGELMPKDDVAVTDADIANSNLILWGDPGSNRVLARLADRLPIRWNAKSVQVRGKTYDAATHVPALIYPNPLNPKKYVVINSGFTFREYDYLNNARQVPKLPDWAVFDVTQPPTSRQPARLVDAGFFSERWGLE